MEEFPEIDIVREPIDEALHPRVDLCIPEKEIDSIYVSKLGPKQRNRRGKAIKRQLQSQPTLAKQKDITRGNVEASQKQSNPGALFELLKTQLKKFDDRLAWASTGRNDGVGAQALGKITVQVMSEALEMQYVHIPFKALEHQSFGAKPDEYARMWEKLLLIGGETTVFPEHYRIWKNLDSKDLPRVLARYQFNPQWGYIYRDAHSFVEQFKTLPQLQDAWRDVIRGLRTRYDALPNRSLFRGEEPKGAISIAVHIRRGDIMMRETSKRLLVNQYFIATIGNVITLAKKNGLKPYVHIVSQGDPKEFKSIQEAFEGEELFFHLSVVAQKLRVNHKRGITPRQREQERIRYLHQQRRMLSERKKQQSERWDLSCGSDEAFRMMVMADVLIMSKSAFSYLAGLYSSGLKLYPPGMWLSVPEWCEQYDNWVHVSEIGEIDGDVEPFFNAFL